MKNGGGIPKNIPARALFTRDSITNSMEKVGADALTYPFWCATESFGFASDALVTSGAGSRVTGEDRPRDGCSIILTVWFDRSSFTSCIQGTGYLLSCFLGR